MQVQRKKISKSGMVLNESVAFSICDVVPDLPDAAHVVILDAKKDDSMLEISTAKIVRVIALTREYGTDHPHLHEYIASFNDDEKANLVALMWVGRESFEPEQLEEAKLQARQEATAPTEDYLSGIPNLAEYLEDGLDALGVDVADAEDRM